MGFQIVSLCSTTYPLVNFLLAQRLRCNLNLKMNRQTFGVNMDSESYEHVEKAANCAIFCKM